MKTKIVLGKDLEVGMRICAWGDLYATISHIRDYVGVNQEHYDKTITLDPIHKNDDAALAGYDRNIAPTDWYWVVDDRPITANSILCDFLVGKTTWDGCFVTDVTMENGADGPCIRIHTSIGYEDYYQSEQINLEN
ncbi:hypothetical protein HPMBJEAJ_00083 [Aeromonas phage avDM6]|nr:hypothetical protein HPMBJEAJ_00083 [Aeromonas phage avDM6]